MKKNFNDGKLSQYNPASAYVAGLYFADGAIISTTGGRYISSIISKDVSLIKTLKVFFESSNKIEIREGKYYKLSLCSYNLYADFIRYGLTERKSCDCSTPNIPEEFYDSFLMGFFDGDGSLSLNSSVNSWKLSFGTCCFNMFNWLKDVFNDKGLIYSVEYRKTDSGKNFYSVVLTGMMAKLLLDDMYNSIEGYIKSLDRKYKLYNKLRGIDKFSAPYYQDWELEIMSNSNLTNKQCKNIIENHNKNLGWRRSQEGIYRKRKQLGYI